MKRRLISTVTYLSAGFLLPLSANDQNRVYFQHRGPEPPFRELPEFRGHELSYFVMAPEVNCPVSVVAEPGGAIYALCDGNAGMGRLPDQGKVWRLVDEDDDGKADYGTEFIPNIDTPRGGHFLNGTLYLAHPPFISAFRDTDGDGVADEHKVLAEGFAHDLSWKRGGDHTTNDLRVGIDGWIYVAVGDFGASAVGSDGSKAKLMSGGVIRMRLDGSDLEVYTQGTRNTYDLAINHRLDLLAMDNTNDGDGWDMRLHHLSPLAHMGYPNLYKNFSEDAMAPLFVYGGGSGCGALYLEEPGFPDWFNQRFHTISWGKLHTHNLKPHEATFVNEDEIYLTLNKLVDLDVDGSSRLYFANFEGGGARIEPGAIVGHIVQAKPKGWSYEAFPDLATASNEELISFLDQGSAVLRHQAQRVLIEADDENTLSLLTECVEDDDQSLESRLAALYAVNLREDDGSVDLLKQWLEDDTLAEYALRALSDRKDTSQLDLEPIVKRFLEDENPRIQLHAIVAARRLELTELTADLLELSRKEAWLPLEKGIAHVHEIVPHTAQRALIEMAPVSSLHESLSDPELRQPALLALRQIHTTENVSRLIEALNHSGNDEARHELVAVLLRLYQSEKEWDGESWWGTRPNSAGPYYHGATWEGSEAIAEALRKAVGKMDEEAQNKTLFEVRRHNLSLDELQLPIEVDPLMQLLDQSSHTFEQQADLLSIATDSERFPQMRIDAFRAALNVTGFTYAEWAVANLKALEAIQKSGDSFSLYQDLSRDFVQSPSHRISMMQRVPKAESKIRKLEPAQRALFYDVICTLAQSPLTTPDDRNRVINGLDSLSPELLESIERNRATAFTAALKREAKKSEQAAAVLASLEDGSEEALVGELSISEVSEAVMKMEGDIEEGRELFARQSCVACHSILPDEPQKGPYLGTVGNLFNREQLITHVIDPGAEVAQGFQTYNFTMKDASVVSGFVTARDDESIEVRNIAGVSQKLPTPDVSSEQILDVSMMPPGLVNALTLKELASMIDFLQSLH